ncbi:nucleic acid/nucleotide deaminase domain-containing protein [Amycolatopsis dongchuanensis]|uniref:Methyl-accepting transducer domain-containing protein n=1 Tax=Amycolatopsis dongchuanensis TaxID=1070866 RepID=A0ABP9Q189_9PSEU
MRVNINATPHKGRRRTRRSRGHSGHRLRTSLILALITALLGQLLGTVPADARPAGVSAVAADSPAPVAKPREIVLALWRSGGSQVKPAAERALLGSDADVDAFLNSNVDRLHALDDRIAVDQILASGGASVKAAAQRALDAASSDPTALRTFLEGGWGQAQTNDLRVRVDQILAAGGPQVQAAAQAALDDGSHDALQRFLTTTSGQAEAKDLRIQVDQILAAGGPEVRAAAQTALDAQTTDALRLFIDREWEVAEARDAETESISQLAESARIAGEQAEQETQAAKDSAAKALVEAELARQAAEFAAAAAEQSQHNAQGAAEAANRAADAANRAASAATAAIGAANAATSAARVAASAAARASAAAAKAGQASSTAWRYAAAARTDRSKAGDASQAARDAADASTSAQNAVISIERAQVALGKAREAVDAATSAKDNANKAAVAAQDSVRWAQAAGADASRASAAAATAQRQADIAAKAASAARDYADAAAAAAAQAHDLASRAAADAAVASTAAADAAAHAGEAQNAAQLATEHANSATAAAQTAVDSANQAQALYDAARKADAARLEVQADQATDAAQQTLDVHDELGLTRNRDLPQEAQYDADTKAWIAEATAPGADPALVVADGRKIALRLLDTGGPWTQAAAEGALTGDDVEVTAFVQTRLGDAAARDDREKLQELIDDGTDAFKAGGQEALAAGDAAVKQFLTNPTYRRQATDLRITVNQVLAAAREDGNATVAAAAQTALDTGTVPALKQFLDTGQNIAHLHDDRIALDQLIANPDAGPETKSLAQAALSGSPQIVRQYREAGQYVAERHDHEAAVHDSAVAGLVAEAHSIAAKATQNAATAQAVAATARGAADAAAGYARDADNSAAQAANFANQAAQSAQRALASAQQAARSADTAATAAKRASQAATRATLSAINARNSANSAARSAQSAVAAWKQAYDDATAAGADAASAVAAANDAATKATAKAEAEQAAAKEAARQQLNDRCGAVPEGPDRDKCIATASRLVEDPEAESQRNVALCRQLQGVSDEALKQCLNSAYDPALAYLVDQTIHQVHEAETEKWWVIGGTVVAGALVLGVGILCAETCAVPILGGLASLSAGTLATAAGAGLELSFGAELLAGVASDALLASRVTALTEAAFLTDTAVSRGLAQLSFDLIKSVAGCLLGVRSLTAAAASNICIRAIDRFKAGELSDAVVHYRYITGELKQYGRNYAAAKLPNYIDPDVAGYYANLEKPIPKEMQNVIFGNSSAGSGHAENDIIEKIKGMGRSPQEIERLFTERSPCGPTSSNCELLLQNELKEGTEVNYWVKWLPGKVADDANSPQSLMMNEELRDILLRAAYRRGY